MLHMPHFRKSENARGVNLNITTATFFRLAVLIIGTLTLMLAVRRASHALLLVFTAFFLALAEWSGAFCKLALARKASQ